MIGVNDAGAGRRDKAGPMQVENQDAVIAFLADPRTHGADMCAVERVDTHISALFLAGDRVYKLKRAVRFPYLDFSTLALRRAACEAEVALNRRTAPSLYLGTVAVTRDGGGRLALDGGGEPVDWLVVMRRFDQDTLFDRMAERGALTVPLMETLAEAIARFHRDAEIKRAAGGAAGMRRATDGIAKAFADAPAGIFDAARVARYVEATERALRAASAAARCALPGRLRAPLPWRSASAQHLPRRRQTDLVRRPRIRRGAGQHRRAL